MSEHVVLRRDLDDADGRDRLVRFRLFYEGSLGSQSGRPEEHQRDPKSDHKHDIRMVFDRQLKHLWETMPSLAAWETDGGILGMNFHKRVSMKSALYNVQPELAGYKFVPLVCAEFGILCKIDVLILRRDKPGGIWTSRDIDNRVKVLFDALSVPRNMNQLGPKARAGAKDGDAIPVCVLLQDDSLITQMNVETDELLAPPNGADDSYSRVMLTVDLSIYRATMANIGVF